MTDRPAGCGCHAGVVCRLCQLAGLTAAAECQYRGSRVYVAGSNRDWRACEHPTAPLGNPVCRCQGCGPKCVGYSPEDTEGNEPCKT